MAGQNNETYDQSQDETAADRLTPYCNGIFQISCGNTAKHFRKTGSSPITDTHSNGDYLPAGYVWRYLIGDAWAENYSSTGSVAGIFCMDAYGDELQPMGPNAWECSPQ